MGLAATGVCGADGRWMTKVSRREAGVSNVRNSLVGERDAGGLGACSAGMRLPLRLDSTRGSIDLRRL